MQVSIETTSGLERRLTIGVPAEQIDSKADERLQEVSKTARINGFRKGKVPLKVVKNQYGEAVRQEILGDVINTSLQEALEKEDVNIAGQPKVEIKQFETGKDLEYTATFEVYPEVSVAGFEGFTIEKLDAEINDESIEKMIESLREQQASFASVERAAADGDQVNINYTGTKDGEEFEGGKADNQDLLLGSNSMIPGFEDGIIGLKAGDEKVLSLTFPEEYHAEELKGAAVEFAVTVNSVSEKTLPEVDEEFLKKFGAEHGDMDKFREDIVKSMERELSSAIKNKVKTSIMDQLLEANQIDVPKALVVNEIDALRGQMMQQFGGMEQNKDFDVRSILPDEMFTEQAERRVSLGLLLSEIVKENELKADDEKVRTAVEELAASYDDPAQVIDYYYQNPQLLNSVEASVLEDSVVDLVMGKATVTEKTVSYEEAVKPQEK